ncbi:MAG: YggT family protein, partial [Acidimicrobiia bacterium]
VYRATEPILAPVRRVIPPIGGIDLSILIVILGINLVLVPIAAAL